MCFLKWKNSFTSYLISLLLFLFLALTFFSIYFEGSQSRTILYLAILFLVLFAVSAFAFALGWRFLGDFFKLLKMLILDKDDKTYNLVLSHTTCQVVDVKSWHDKNANSYTEIWIKTPNCKEHLVKLTNSQIAVRKNHTISIISDSGEPMAVFNHSSNDLYPINNIYVVTSSWQNIILLFLFEFFSFIISGVVGLVTLLVVVMLLVKRKIKEIRYKQDWNEISSYLKMAKLV